MATRYEVHHLKLGKLLQGMVESVKVDFPDTLLPINICIGYKQPCVVYWLPKSVPR